MIRKSIFWISHHILLLALIWALWILLRGNNRRRAREFSDGRIEFLPRKIAYPAWILIVVFLAHAAAVFVMLSHGKPFDLLRAAFSVFIALAFLCGFPGTIIITSEAVQQVFWFRKSKRVRWEHIVEINAGGKSRMVTITGADGTKIVYSSQLADRPRLLQEIKQHCGENLPPEFPASTT